MAAATTTQISIDSLLQSIQSQTPPDTLSKGVQNAGPSLRLCNRRITDRQCHMLQEFFMQLHTYGLVQDVVSNKYSYGNMYHQDSISSDMVLATSACNIGAFAYPSIDSRGKKEFDDVSVSSAVRLEEGCIVPLCLLDLSYNYLTVHGLRLFIRSVAIANTSSLFAQQSRELILDLSFNHFSGIEVGKLFSSILKHKHSRISSLNLTGNRKLGNKAVELIARALIAQANCTKSSQIKLQSLYLNNTGMSSSSAIALNEALFVNTHVKYLELMDNDIDKSILESIGRLLARNRAEFVPGLYSITNQVTPDVVHTSCLTKFNGSNPNIWKVEKELFEETIQLYQRQIKVMEYLDYLLSQEIESYQGRVKAMEKFIYGDIKKWAIDVSKDNGLNKGVKTVVTKKKKKNKGKGKASLDISKSEPDMLLISDDTALIGEEEEEEEVIVEETVVEEEEKDDIEIFSYVKDHKKDEVIQCGKTYHLHIQGVDSDQKNMEYGGEEFQVMLKHNAPKGGEISIPITDWNIQIQDLCNGIYRFDYTPLLGGEYKIEILQRRKPIKGSPVNINVIPEPYANLTSINGLKNSLIYYTDKPMIFRIVSKDVNGNPLMKSAGYHFDASLKRVDHYDPLGSKVELVREIITNFSEQGDGTITVTHNVSKSGIYVLEVLYNNEHILGSPCPVTVVSPSYAPYCKCRGSGIEKYGVFNSNPSTYSFLIFAFDGNGKEIRTGGETFNAKFTPSNNSTTKTPQVTVMDNQDGTYTVKYTLEQEGSFDVHVNLIKDGKELPVFESPFRIHRSIDRMSAKSSSFGQIGRFYKDHSTKIPIYPKNENNLPVVSKRNKPRIELSITNPHKHTATIHTHESSILNEKYGLLLTNIKPTFKGDYEIKAVYDGEHIQGSPLKITVHDHSISPCANQSIVRGPGVGISAQICPEFAHDEIKTMTYECEPAASPIFANEVTRFMVILRDNEGDQLKTGGDLVQVTISTIVGDEISAIVKDLNNGKYLVEYTPPFPGRYNVVVYVNYHPLRNRPFQVFVSENPKDLKTAAIIKPVIQVNVKRLNGQSVTEEQYKKEFHQLKVNFTGPGQVIYDLDYKGDGTYEIEVKGASQPGKYKANVHWNSMPVEGSPYDIQI